MTNPNTPEPSPLPEETTRLLRHLLATIAYRASQSLRDAPARFENSRVSDGMTAGELVRHMTNVLAFAVATLTQTERVRHEALDWGGEVARFYAILQTLDARLEAGARVEAGLELRILQGPLADVLTHIGQLHMLRRVAGAPVSSVNYVRAEISAGRIALDALSD